MSASVHPPVPSLRGWDHPTRGRYVLLEDVVGLLDWCTEVADPISRLGIEKVVSVVAAFSNNPDLLRLAPKGMEDA